MRQHRWLFDPKLECYICFPHPIEGIDTTGFCKGCGRQVSREVLAWTDVRKLPFRVAPESDLATLARVLDYLAAQI